MTADDMPAPQPRADGLAGAEAYGLSAEAGLEHASWPDTLAKIDASRSWWISTTRPDGRPHAMPVWGIVAAGRILFSTGPTSVKAQNLAHNPALVMHTESGDDVIVIEGSAASVAGADLPADFVARYEQKYGFEVDTADPGFGFFQVVPVKGFTWLEASFAETAVRWHFG